MDEQHERAPTGTTLADPGTDAFPLALAGGHSLHLQRGSTEDVLRVEARDGTVRVAVVVTPRGTRIELDGAELAIRSSGELEVDAQRLSLKGREGLSLATDRDLEVRAGGVVRTEGHAQHLVSRRGDLTLYANDDVKIDAERIKMNC